MSQTTYHVGFQRSRKSLCFSLTILGASENRAVVFWQPVCRSPNTWGAGKTSLLSEILGFSLTLGCWETKNLCASLSCFFRSQVLCQTWCSLPCWGSTKLFLPVGISLKMLTALAPMVLHVSDLLKKKGFNLLGIWVCCNCQLLNLAFQVKLENFVSSSVLHFDYSSTPNLPILLYLDFVHPYF